MTLQRPLIFCRHAQSIGNPISQDQRANLETPNHAYPLTEIGIEQARLMGKYLKEKCGRNPPRLYFQSTFKRSQETLAIIMEELRVRTNPITDSRLDEKWDGIFHELSSKEVTARYPEQIKLRKILGYYHHRPPGGQNGPDVELQIRSFIQDYLTSYHPKGILIVGHGRWFLFFQKLVHNLSIDRLLHMKKMGSENGSITFYPLLQKESDTPESYTPWKGTLSETKGEYA